MSKLFRTLNVSAVVLPLGLTMAALPAMATTPPSAAMAVPTGISSSAISSATSPTTTQDDTAPPLQPVHILLAQAVATGDAAPLSTQIDSTSATPVADTNWEPDATNQNVNGRYLVESVNVMRHGTPTEVSQPLQTELDQIVGQNYDHGMLDGLADRMKDELRVPDVDVSVSRGATQDHVTVTFVIGEHERDGFDLDLERFLYHSKQGWTGEGNATVRLQGNAFSFGLVSDGDRMAERFAGIKAGYERYAVGTNRLSLRFDFLSFHQQWNRATLAAANPDQIYRSRQHFIPEATLYIAEPLTLSFGVDFARYRIAVPSPVGFDAGARTESSNAVVSTLRYHQRWDSDSGTTDSGTIQDLTTSYGVRSGTGVLESDRSFTKHQGEVQYVLRQGNNTLEIGFLTGRIGGSAPIYERFILGNAELLRGWNKFDLAPLGATRAVHGSIDYSYRSFLIFYDTGAVWDQPAQREQKQSLGLGFREGGVEMAVAWPIKSGKATPVFYIGMNF